MYKEKSVLTVLVISLFALFFLGARTYYSDGGHMMGGMHGDYKIGNVEDYGMYGHGMMGSGMGCYMMGEAGVADYYLYNKDVLRLSKSQRGTFKSLKEKYSEKNLILRTSLYKKSFELG